MSSEVCHVNDNKNGYGIVYQRIMDNDVLHRDSKAIYAYLCSYADKDGICYPTRARIKTALQMNDKTFKKYMDPLIELGVVEVEKTTTSRGLLGRNVYHLIHAIDYDTSHRVVSHRVASQQVASQQVASYHDTSQSRCILEGSTNINTYNSNILNNNNINSNSIYNAPVAADHQSDMDKRQEPIRHKYGEYKNVLLSDEDIEKLKMEFPNDWEDRIERLSSYVASTGKSYKNHLATIRNWARKDKSDNNGVNERNHGKEKDKPTMGIII